MSEDQKMSHEEVEALRERVNNGDRAARDKLLAFIEGSITKSTFELLNRAHGPQLWADMREQVTAHLGRILDGPVEVPAGRLREMGVEVPDSVPNHAPYTFDGVEVVGEDYEKGVVNLSMNYKPVPMFEFEFTLTPKSA